MTILLYIIIALLILGGAYLIYKLIEHRELISYMWHPVQMIPDDIKDRLVERYIK
jgi:hypothetical protein